MIPGSRVVACPCCRVSLASRICSAGQYEGPDIRPQCELSLECGSRILHPIHIVDLAMCGGASRESRLVNPVNDRVRHRLQRVENGGLIHVVPEAIDASLSEVLVETAPPDPRLLLREIGK